MSKTLLTFRKIVEVPFTIDFDKFLYVKEEYDSDEEEHVEILKEKVIKKAFEIFTEV